MGVRPFLAVQTLNGHKHETVPGFVNHPSEQFGTDCRRQQMPRRYEPMREAAMAAFAKSWRRK
jgi:hypothetical protein